MAAYLCEEIALRFEMQNHASTIGRFDEIAQFHYGKSAHRPPVSVVNLDFQLLRLKIIHCNYYQSFIFSSSIFNRLLIIFPQNRDRFEIKRRNNPMSPKRIVVIIIVDT